MGPALDLPLRREADEVEVGGARERGRTREGGREMGFEVDAFGVPLFRPRGEPSNVSQISE